MNLCSWHPFCPDCNRANHAIMAATKVSPSCRTLYWFYLAVFLVFMLVMALTDLSGMVNMPRP